MAVDGYKFKFVENSLCAAEGFKVGTVYAGIRKTERDDLMLLVSEKVASVAGVLTTNNVKAWSVQHNQQRLKGGKAKAIFCLAGNANCCNGEKGREADLQIEASLKELLTGQELAEILTASTGIIGRELAVDKILNKLEPLCSSLSRKGDRAASAIMTTDLVSKSYALEVEHSSGARFKVGGISKGSGMIAPNMATMLGFVTSDIEISPADLTIELQAANSKSFNCITVDGDTSTNDSLFVLANGASGQHYSNHKDAFSYALKIVCQELAKMIARDGEGATKLVEIKVSGANSEKDCFQIAKTIAESPLVKTACFGNDPNWGRILAAAGRSGINFDYNKVAVSLAGFEIFENGEPTAFDAGSVSNAMKQRDLKIDFRIDSKNTTEITVWTCDFSYDYVKINADYGT